MEQKLQGRVNAHALHCCVEGLRVRRSKSSQWTYLPHKLSPLDTGPGAPQKRLNHNPGMARRLLRLHQVGFRPLQTRVGGGSINGEVRGLHRRGGY
jgi:hypothetical protein